MASLPKTIKASQPAASEYANRVAHVSPATAKLLSSIQSAVLTDPGLPRPHPTISSWQVPAHPTVATIQSRVLPRRTDFAIIGSGITGCSVAKSLLEHPGADGGHVTVIEARTLVSGATGRNGGHLVTASGHTYGPLVEQHGVTAAKEITRFSILNVERIIAMVRRMDQDLQTECEMRDVLKVMAVSDEETWAKAKRSVLEFQKAVPEYSTFHRIIEKEDIPERWNIKNASGAIEHQAGAIWPYRLLTGIYERLLIKYPERLAIEANTPVTKIKHLPEGDAEYPYSIETARGIIRTKRVIHCTNAYASHLLPELAGRVYPFRGTMTVQDPGPSLRNLGMSRSWSLAHKSSLDAQTGLYITGLYSLQQNALTGKIWIGNETAYLKDILTSDDTYVPEEAKQALSTMLPNFFLKGWNKEITSNIKGIWSGIQGHTADGLPLVGRVPTRITGDPSDNEQWIAAGFNGYGMDKCWLTGEALVKMILGEDVREWFPSCFLLTEKRLEKRLNAEQTVLKFARLADPDTATGSKL